VHVSDAEHLDLVQMVTDAWAWEAGLPRDVLQFCEDNAEYYCLMPSGEVVFWAHNGVTDEQWPDLAAWIKQVWIEEGLAHQRNQDEDE
jgi:hypothetical protein